MFLDKNKIIAFICLINDGISPSNMQWHESSKILYVRPAKAQTSLRIRTD